MVLRFTDEKPNAESLAARKLATNGSVTPPRAPSDLNGELPGTATFVVETPLPEGMPVVPAQSKPAGENAAANYVTVSIRNPASPAKWWSGLFRVDTEVWDSVAPASVLRDIGLAAFGKKKYELADGSTAEFDAGVAQVEFMGDTAGTTVVFGPENLEPILGRTALQSAGIVVDPHDQRLRRLAAATLKKLSNGSNTPTSHTAS